MANLAGRAFWVTVPGATVVAYHLSTEALFRFNALNPNAPEFLQDSTIVDSTFTTFGDMTWAELTALASAEGKDVSSLRPTINNTQPDTTASGACNEATLTNWGDTLPTAPCGAYFPLIYVNGNITIQSGGIGQGILLVDGDLDLRGNFLFYGLIVGLLALVARQGEVEGYNGCTRL